MEDLKDAAPVTASVLKDVNLQITCKQGEPWEVVASSQLLLRFLEEPHCRCVEKPAAMLPLLKMQASEKSNLAQEREREWEKVIETHTQILTRIGIHLFFLSSFLLERCASLGVMLSDLLSA